MTDNGTETEDDQGQRVCEGQFLIAIAGADLIFRKIAINDSTPSGIQIARAFGGSDPDELIVLQQLPTFELEELRHAETTDIKARGIERFIVVNSDRLYRLIVDGIDLVWPLGSPPVSTVKALVGKDDDFDLVQELEDCPDRIFGDDEHVNLKPKRTESFKTRPRKRTVTVKYNHEPVVLEVGIYTTEELIAEFGVPNGYVLVLIGDDGEFIDLKPGRKIPIKHCLEFISHAPCGGAA